jgi:D-lyxose ketol-isomerase
MKRSEINDTINQAKSFLERHCFHLPPWAFWAPSDWKGKRPACAEIIDNSLGWDITDFGSGDFASIGLMLFTIRNGDLSKPGQKTYAEKIMVVEENQVTPLHYHWKKMEDIINRGGGNLVIDLYGSNADDSLSEDAVTVQVDSVKREVHAGGQVILAPGESICLVPGLYHRFYGEAGRGTVLVGEVSQVNDDASDNNFHEEVGRFPAIDEDVAPVHPLCNEYGAHL